MRRALPYLVILGVGTALAVLPLLSANGTLINTLIVALIVTLAAQGWNVLGGFGGQVSFGHAAFFGVGAYGIALCQVRLGLSPYLGFVTAVACAALIGLVIGALSFRSGLRGSYFALVTLAFAEVFRILANASPATGGAAGTLIPLKVSPENFQFADRIVFFWIILAAVVAVLAGTQWLAASRLGAYLVAVRENEDAAQALGVDSLAVKLKAITLSAAITGMAGAFYAQYFLFIDAGIAFGPWISIEALLAPIIGGIGTVFGPLLGAFILHALGEVAKSLAGRTLGLDLALYGVLLILVVAFARDGIVGVLMRLFRGSPRTGTSVRRPA